MREVTWKFKFSLVFLLLIGTALLTLYLPEFLRAQSDAPIPAAEAAEPFVLLDPAATSNQQPTALSSTATSPAVAVALPSAENNCTNGMDYWRSHPGSWRFTGVQLGSLAVSKENAEQLLLREAQDAREQVTQQLILYVLNTTRGADPGPVLETIAEMREWLDSLPPGGEISAPTAVEGQSLAAELEAYNEGLIGPGVCPEVTDTPTPTVTSSSTPTETATQTLTPTRTATIYFPTRTKTRVPPKPKTATPAPTQPPPPPPTAVPTQPPPPPPTPPPTPTSPPPPSEGNLAGSHLAHPAISNWPALAIRNGQPRQLLKLAQADGPESSLLLADLVLEKSGAPEPVIAGNAITYALTTTNLLPDIASDVVLTDTLPTGVVFAAASPACSYAAVDHQVICSLGAISSTVTSFVSITVDVESVTTGSLLNQAVVVHSTSESDPGNNTAAYTSTVETSADMALLKSDSADPIAAGAVLTYTLAGTNTGPSDAVGLVITDTLPADFIFSTASPGCTYSAGPHEVVCAFAALPAGLAGEATISGVTDTGFTGLLTNTATLTTDTSDPNLANNTDEETTLVVELADLAISKLDDPDPVIAGSGFLTYTVQVDNLGPSLAASVSVTDTLPAGVTYLSSLPSQGACGIIGMEVLCGLGDLGTGGTASIEIVVSVNPDTSGALTNTAQVGSNTADPLEANNTAAAITQVDTAADIVISMLDQPDPVAAGSALTYTLALTNTGPSVAASAAITDSLPAGVTFVSAISSLGTCSQSSGTVTCDPGTLAVSQAAAVTIVVDVNQDAVGPLVNLAETASATFDANAANNTASASTEVIAVSDLQILKTGLPSSLPPGGTLTYTLSALNIGPTDSMTVTLVDDLPAETSFVSANPSQGSCSGTATVTCDIGALASGGVATATIVVVVDGATISGTTIVNAATISGANTDPNLTNNLAELDTIISNALLDLTLTKTASAANVDPGAPLTYTLQVGNAGPSTATSVVLTDTLPSDVTLNLAAASSGSCLQSNPVRCDIGSLAQGATGSVTITVQVNEMAAGNLVNTAVAVNSVPDVNLGNNTASTSTSVTPHADLLLTISDQPDPVLATSPALTYVLAVENSGPAAASDVLLEVTFPLEFSPGPPFDPPCAGTSMSVTCDMGTLMPGETSEVSFTEDVAPGTLGTITLNASVSSSTIDPSLANNAASEDTLVDLEAPVLSWLGPIAAGQILNVGTFYNGIFEVQLSVDASDNMAVDRVLFERWDPVELVWIEISTLYAGPFDVVLPVGELRPGWNQIFARAFDPAGNRTDSFIWLYHWKPTLLPFVIH